LMLPGAAHPDNIANKSNGKINLIKN